jgi:hypothetical protein
MHVGGATDAALTMRSAVTPSPTLRLFADSTSDPEDRHHTERCSIS